MQNFKIKNIQLRGHLGKTYVEYLSFEEYLISEDIRGKIWRIFKFRGMLKFRGHLGGKI